MRKALVIGVGGTGATTLTLLKNRLLSDARYSRLTAAAGAPTVREQLRSVGTPEWSTATVDGWGIQLLEFEVDARRPEIGEGVRLSDDEFRPISDQPLGDLVNNLKQHPDGAREAVMPEVRQWLPHSHAQNYELKRAQEFLRDGAGEIRQFGRMVLFLELANAADVPRLLHSALRDLAATTVPAGQDSRNYVYLVGSLAGGTGGGMLLDIIGLLHEAEDRLGGRGAFSNAAYLVLPGYYAGGVLTDREQVKTVNANGYAMARELERMMCKPESVSFQWPKGRRYTLKYGALDYCYLIDGTRADSAQPITPGKHPERGLPPAIADAIYAHVFPSTGAVMASDESNLATSAIKAGIPDRFSTFGSYTLTYHWEPLTRSLACKAAERLVHIVQAGDDRAGREEADDFLTKTKGARGAYSADTLQGSATQVLPLLASAGLVGSPADFVSNWGRLTDYLVPESDLPDSAMPVPIPVVPDLFALFPDLPRGALGFTPYTHAEVQAAIEGTRDENGTLIQTGVMDAFWGPESGAYRRLPGGNPTFNGAVALGRAEAAWQFERALRLAATSVAHRHRDKGGLAVARALIAEVSRRCSALDVMLKADQDSFYGDNSIEAARRDVQVAREGMIDGGLIANLDNHIEQSAYLQAATNLMQLLYTEKTITATLLLAQEFAKAASQVDEELAGWQVTLDGYAEALAGERERINHARADLDENALQDYRPQPEDKAENTLFERFASDEMLRARIQSGVKWRYYEKAGQGRVVLADPTFDGSDGADPGPLTRDALQRIGYELLMPLRTMDIFEVMSLYGEVSGTADEIVKRVFAGMPVLANHNPLGALTLDGNTVKRGFKYVFGHFPQVGPGADLAGLVRQKIEARGVSTHETQSWVEADLAGADQAFSLPGTYVGTDKLQAVEAVHLAQLDVFTGVTGLRADYRERRDPLEVVPGPHVFPAEMGAARLEMAADRWAQSGLLERTLEELPPSLVSCATDQVLLASVAVCAAYGKIVNTAGKGVGVGAKWHIGESSEPFHNVDVDASGSALSLSTAVRVLLSGSDTNPDVRRGRVEVRSLAVALQQESDAMETLGAYARAGAQRLRDEGDVQLDDLLKAGAALVADVLAS